MLLKRFFSAMVLGLSLTVTALPLQAQETGADVPTLRVNGQGVVTAAPDMASLTLGVTERAKTAPEAMDAVSQSVSAILTRLKAAGISGADVQTSDLSLGPIWDNRSSGNRPEVSGFEASNRLTIRVRDLDRLGDVLGAALEDGANRMSGLRFGLTERRPLEDEARRAAVADALAKAQLYAEAAGVTLGPILSISEGFVSRPEPGIMMAARAESVPVAAGETGISAQVQMVFALQP
ncbi:SIMPL domain-containing protein [Thalassococcus lentus]|uniref:SIMPL domain-containing protein n=1 Tax=Thalassococcus lentus TaxID=1210524 RepID=A0ABT4XVC0_9RHOB|nr:SIMPL domain-containing protein [Thalassococcus lentus]MDA7425868.1 SIMPL domain-containing protein [Thalassococcus lentus]